MTVLSPSVADLSSLEPDLQTPSSPTKPVCDYATYMRLLAENADLQRTCGLLRLEAGKSGLGEAEKVEALQTELKILSANNKVSGIKRIIELCHIFCSAGLGEKAGPRFGEFCFYSCLPLVPGFACNIHTI